VLQIPDHPMIRRLERTGFPWGGRPPQPPLRADGAAKPARRAGEGRPAGPYDRMRPV